MTDTYISYFRYIHTLAYSIVNCKLWPPPRLESIEVYYYGVFEYIA